MAWYVYLVRTVDDRLYAGVTTDVARRYGEHEAQGAKAAKYLLAHRPAELAFCQEIGERSLALRVEYRLRRLSRRRKERIVERGELVFDPVTGRIVEAGTDKSQVRSTKSQVQNSRRCAS